jgi:ParB family chromosome partitioning protein
MAKKTLGRGLAALLGRHPADEPSTTQVLEVPLREIKPNPWQPRVNVGTDTLQSLTESIRAHGVLQPLVLRRHQAGGYEIVAGERRWRAATQAGLSTVPAILRDVPDTHMLLFALLENLQREDLNPIERAHGYTTLMKSLGCTQERLAEHLGEARTTVSNTIRLLELPQDIQDLVSRGTLTAGHARALLALRDPQAQKRLCERILKENLSVRQVEQLTSGTVETPRVGRGARPIPPHIRELQERLQHALGAKVLIRERKRGGKITIEFSTHDDFDRILAILERA